MHWLARLTAVLVSAFVLCGLSIGGISQARADIVVIPDPDQWITDSLNKISAGRTEDFARDFLRLIGKSDDFESFHRDVAILGQIGKPVFMEKVSDERFGGEALRQVIFVALYRQVDYIYFRFVVKKNRDGYAITNFQFKDEAADLFPPGFRGPR